MRLEPGDIVCYRGGETDYDIGTVKSVGGPHDSVMVDFHGGGEALCYAYNLRLASDFLPPDASDAVGAIFAHGAAKYGGDNWAEEDNGGGDHIAAALRHLGAHLGGKVWDDEQCTRRHLSHATARLMMALGKELRKNDSCE